MPDCNDTKPSSTRRLPAGADEAAQQEFQRGVQIIDNLVAKQRHVLFGPIQTHATKKAAS